MPEINRNLSFDAGIERVLSTNDWQPMGLPDAARGLTAEAPVDQRLAEVLYPPSVEQGLVDSCRPDVQNPDVLTPGGYQRALEDTRAKLQEALKRATSPEDMSKLQSAIALLQEDAGLRDLLNTYRHLLHRA
jgi:hypothetical protein